MEETTTPVLSLAATHVGEVQAALRHLDLDAVERVAERLHQARLRGATIYVAGNGGSAATASHWVNDLGKATRRWGGCRTRVMSLSDSTSWLTAVANDEGYEHAFAEQLENFATPGDLLVLVSASGSSPNLLRAVDVAQAHGMETAALLGFDGGLLKERVDEHVLVSTPKGAYELVEDLHNVVCHICTRILCRPA